MPSTFEHLATSIRDIDAALHAQASKAVNISLTVRNWLIGCYIAKYELHGADRAAYGDYLLPKLAGRLADLHVSACAKRQLYQYLRFYRVYPGIVRSLTSQFQYLLPQELTLDYAKVRSVTALSGVDAGEVLHKLSYTHIEQLVAIDDETKRAFYEFECIRGNWSVRELKRQIGSLYYERSGLSGNYVSWYRKNIMSEGDNPPVGILLCTQKDHALVEYALAGINNLLFVSKYQLALPCKEEIQRFIEREIANSGYPEDDSKAGRLVREMREKYAEGESQNERL